VDPGSAKEVTGHLHVLRPPDRNGLNRRIAIARSQQRRQTNRNDNRPPLGSNHLVNQRHTSTFNLHTINFMIDLA
jgi:hypothetical protein